MKRKLIATLFLIPLTIISGCATTADKYIREHPDTPESIKNSIRNSRPSVGMTDEQVVAIGGWPSEFIHNKFNNEETWVYYGTYLTFENKKLINIESSTEWKNRTRNRDIDMYFKTHPERSDFEEQVTQKKIQIGMNGEEVKLSWGAPGDINKTVTASGTSEQWIYSSGQYLYFENGFLTTWQN